MNTSDNIPRPFSVLSQALAYLIGGTFLFAAEINGAAIFAAQIMGLVFIATGFFLGIASFINPLLKFANRIDGMLFMGLFITSIGSLIVTIVTGEYKWFIFIIGAFLLLVLVSFLFHIIKNTQVAVSRLRSRRAAINILRVISFVLGVFALCLVIFSVNDMGNPVLYLSFSIVCLSASAVLNI